MNSSKLIRVVSVSKPKEDKNGIPYKSVVLETPKIQNVVNTFNGQSAKVHVKQKRGTINVFAHAYLLLTALANEKGVEIKKLKKEEIKDVEPDFGWDLEVGDQVQGDIVTRKVQPYEIPDVGTGEVRVVDFYTTPVLGDTEDEGYELAIQQTFKRSNHPLHSEKLGMEKVPTVEEVEEKENAISTFEE